MACVTVIVTAGPGSAGRRWIGSRPSLPAARSPVSPSVAWGGWPPWSSSTCSSSARTSAEARSTRAHGLAPLSPSCRRACHRSGTGRSDTGEGCRLTTAWSRRSSRPCPRPWLTSMNRPKSGNGSSGGPSAWASASGNGNGWLRWISPSSPSRGCARRSCATRGCAWPGWSSARWPGTWSASSSSLASSPRPAPAGRTTRQCWTGNCWRRSSAGSAAGPWERRAATTDCRSAPEAAAAHCPRCPCCWRRGVATTGHQPCPPTPGSTATSIPAPAA